MDKRHSMLKDWLSIVLDEPLLSLTPASADASFRRYFRARTEKNSYVVMDAPPKQEPLEPFIKIDRALIQQGVHAPLILETDIPNGFLMLEDLGDKTYLNELQHTNETLYNDAIKSLVRIQLGAYEQNQFKIESYDHNLFDHELNLFEDWYCQKHLTISLSDEQKQIWTKTKRFLIKSCLEQPIVWVHRDFHSRNLMRVEINSPAVIDFQDMVLGPISYDLASLFKDCYIEWPRDVQHRWLEVYLEHASNTLPQLNISIEQLIRWVDLTGLQRHLKVLGVFSRLYYRDGKSNYLDDMPLVKKYILEVSQLYPELSEFSSFFSTIEINALDTVTSKN